jgi:hypothetical protein
MANTPVNILQNVQLYIKSELAWLDNEYWGISNSNKSLEEFNERPGNLGDVITFDVTPRYISYDGLVITEQPSVQRLQSLICSQAKNVSAAYTDEQFIFNVEQYMDRFGIAAAKEIGAGVEADILKNIVSGVVGNNPNSPEYQQPQINSGPFRFYGDGVTPINSYQQLAQAWANFTAFGASTHMKRGVIPIDLVPAIVGTGLNQFAPDRNNEIAKAWELGSYAGLDVKWGVSNLLPIHISGFVQNAAAPNNVWTVEAVSDLTGNNVITITASEPTTSTAANAVLAGDLFQFNDGVTGYPNLRFLTFIGHNPTRLPVQFRAIANANTVAGVATIQIQTINNSIGLVWAQNQNQNINNTIQVGMQFTGLPSHQAGWMDAGNSFYVAMPRLPNQSPFETVYFKDKESGAALRHYWGVQFGKDNRSYVRDLVWGSTLVSEDSMRMIFPM